MLIRTGQKYCTCVVNVLKGYESKACKANYGSSLYSFRSFIITFLFIPVNIRSCLITFLISPILVIANIELSANSITKYTFNTSNCTPPAAPLVNSPVYYCLDATADQLTATGSNLIWGGTGNISGSVGGTNTLNTGAVYVDANASNNRKTNFTTTTSDVTITTVDYYITSWQAVNGLTLGIFNSSGTEIATSSTTTTFNAGSTAVKITNTFNYSIESADDYSIGVSSGYGNIGYDNPSFPISEITGTINLTGVSKVGNRCYNDIKFEMTSSGSTAPIPSTTSAGSTFYEVTQTVDGCISPAATIEVIVTAVPSFEQAPLSGLLRWYKLDGNGDDASGNSNTATLQGSPTVTTDRNNNPASAYLFNGTSQYISTANSVTTANTNTSSQGVWFKTTSTNGGLLIGLGGSQTGGSWNHDRILYMSPTGKLVFGYYNNSNPCPNITTSGSYNDGNWHFVLATFSSTGGIKMYVDGNLIASNPIVGTPYGVDNHYWRSAYLQMGSYWPTPPNWPYYFSGVLDDITIYNRVLTASEVSALYSGSGEGADSNSPVCSGETLNLTVESITGATYSWTGPNGFTSSLQNPTLTYSGAYAGVYTVEADVNGCSTTAFTTVETAAGSSIISYAGSPYCNTTGTASVTFSGTGGGTYSSTAGLTINATTGAVDLGTSTAGTYTVTYSNSSCSATSIITISAPPTTANTGNNINGAATCGVSTTTLAGNTPSVGTGSWTIVSGVGGMLANPSIPTSAFSGTAGISYLLRWTISNGSCTPSTDDVVVKFNQIPTTALAGADQTGAGTCGLTNVTLAANTPVIGTGSWSIILGAGGTVTTPSSPTSTFSGTAGATYTLRWKIANSPCVTSSDDVVITFNESMTVSGTSTETCVGGSTGTITAIAGGGSGPYTYSLNAGAFQSSAEFTSLPAATYTLNAKSSAGCVTSTSVTVSPFSNSGDDQNATGTNSWIGHAYDGISFNSYIGQFTESETFNESFGGNQVCFNVVSNAVTRSIYTETFSVKFKMNSTKKGLYVANLGSDDGSRLTVDGTMVYDHWSLHSFISNSSVLMSLSGSSSLMYEFYENGGENRIVFENLTLVLENSLAANTSQTICSGNSGLAISGDVYGTLPVGITLSGSGYQWSFSTTPGGIRTDIAGETSATLTPSASIAPFDTPGTYYVYRKAILSSVNNVSPTPYVVTNESNPATITVTAAPSATISYAGSPYCSSSGIASVTQSGTTGGSYSSTAGLLINSSTGAVTLASSAAGTYTVMYTIAAAGACPAYSTSTSITVTTQPFANGYYAGNPYCSNEGIAFPSGSWTGIFGTMSSTPGLSLNSSNGVVNLASSTAGTYTVIYTVPALGGCNVYTTSSNITITALPSATISYTGSPYFMNEGTASPVFSGTTGGTYSSTAGLSINASTGVVNLGSSIPNTYSVTYTVPATGGCAIYTTSTSISVLNNIKTWDGGAGTNNWGDAANWNPDGVPTSMENIELTGAYNINVDVAGVTNDLTINNTGLTLTINSGNTLEISGNLSLITGTLSIKSAFPAVAGTIDVSGGTVGFSCSGDQTIPAYNYGNLFSSSAGGRILANSGTIGIAGTFSPGTNYYTIAGSTINYNAPGAQTVAAFNYNNLILNNSGEKSFASGTTGIASALTINGSATTNASMNAAVISYNGATDQTITAMSYYDLDISSTGGIVTGISTAVNNFSMNSGLLDLNSFTLNISGAALYTSGIINNGTVNSTGESTLFAGTEFGASVNASSDLLYLNGSIFNNTVTLIKIGATDITSEGGNIFNSAASISNNGTGYFALANTSPDIFNGDVTFNNAGSNFLYMAFNSPDNEFNGNVICNNTGTGSFIQSSFGASASATFNGNIVINNISTGGIAFGGIGGLTSLAPAKTISIGEAGFTEGVLYLINFTQSGTSPLTLSLSGTALLEVGPSSTFNGNISFSAPQLALNGCTYNGITSITKTGATDNISTGANIFNGTSVITNSGSGMLRLANTTADDWNGDVTFIQTGNGLLQPAFRHNNAIAGNLSTAGSATEINFGAGGGTVTFNGTNAQSITGTSQFANLVLNNTESGNALTLNSPVSINNNFTLTDGHLITSTENILTLGSAATVTLNADMQDSSFVKGPMTHTVNVDESETKVFPVGKNNNYGRVDLTIDQSTATATEYNCEMFNSSAKALNNTLPVGINRVSGHRFFNIAPGTAVDLDAVSVKFYYKAEDQVSDAPSLRIVKDDGAGNWMDLGGSGSGSPAGEITSNVFNSFSDFALANSSGGLNALPIELMTFTAEPLDNKVELNWGTASELNNDYFSIERSNDGVNFETVVTVEGAGNSNSFLWYTTFDEQPFTGWSYYRLKQTDFNGEYAYSDIQAVQFVDKSQPQSIEFNLFPNPSNGLLVYMEILDVYNLNSGEMKITVYDVQGKVVYTQMEVLEFSHSQFISLDFGRKFPAGLYSIAVTSGMITSKKKFIVN